MDTYLNDEQLKKDIYNIIDYSKENNMDYFDEESTNIQWNYKYYIHQFREKYMDILLDDDFIDALQELLSDYYKKSPKYRNPSIIKFLCWIANYSDDNDKIKILKYIVDNYSNELEFNFHNIFNNIIKECNKPETMLKCMEIYSEKLIDEKVNKNIKIDELEDDKRIQNERIEELENENYSQKERIEELEDENDSQKNKIEELEELKEELQEENCNLKERIEELELQIKYMPGGDEYNMAREHFESLKN